MTYFEDVVLEIFDTDGDGVLNSSEKSEFERLYSYCSEHGERAHELNEEEAEIVRRLYFADCITTSAKLEDRLIARNRARRLELEM